MFNAILLPVDGSALSYEPVHKVIGMAKLTASRIIVLSVAEPRLFRASDVDSVMTGQMVESINLQAARENVEKVLAIAKQNGVACESVVSLSYDSCQEILNTVQKACCDLIVMATRGKMSLIDAIFNESTTLEVLRKSPVPVLVFPWQ